MQVSGYPGAIVDARQRSGFCPYSPLTVKRDMQRRVKSGRALITEH